MGLTLAQLETQALQTAEVYLPRFAGEVTLQELTGPQVLMAAQYARELVAGTEGMVAVNPSRHRALRLAFALQLDGEPEGLALAQVLDRRTPILENLAWSDLLLLSTVLDVLSQGRLTEAQRGLLARDCPTEEKLDGLLGVNAPENVLEQAGADAEKLLAVAAAGIPQVLTGEISVPVVAMLYDALMAAEGRLAEKLAEALRG
jgi:hypothetical protein